ncbi:hypothetical protein IWQ62_003923 [Dispira parvispora]|uniref:DUF4436 domain-containing protein n=1 Tax=Dispira parvispora TaxID=1520584 RepID=A0A9W8E642_9FUNG|nr:hypothetical protein IWQ62_003923 [Dispira parvispora]
MSCLQYLQSVTVRRIIYTISIAAILCILIPVTVVVYKNEELKKNVIQEYLSQSQDGIMVSVMVQSTDLNSRKMDVQMDFTPAGFYSNDYGELTVPLTFTTGLKTLTFPANQAMQSADVSIPFVTGSTRNFPFDNFSTYYYIAAKETNGTDFIPLEISFDGTISTVSITSDVVDSTSRPDLGAAPNIFFFQAVVTRTGFTQFYSVLIAIAMWLLAIAKAILAFQASVANRDVAPPLIIFGATMMFAFPTLRNSLPGAPQIGCLYDVVCFFWPMLVIVLSTCTVVYNYILRWNPPTPSFLLSRAPPAKGPSLESVIVRDSAGQIEKHRL